MGVPALFRWLVNRYARLTDRAVEESPRTVNGVTLQVDASQPNPNGTEFDNLYLDMNGIIHPCVHPENEAAPETVEAMYLAVFKYIDRIFNIVRPRRVLYMAIDGVAPRAKMNQQRSRRFRTARDAAEKAASKEELLRRTSAVPEEDIKAAHSSAFDTNAITPGTEFMADLAVALRYFVISRMNTDPAWRTIQVYLSDASVPGEGEHKIMDFIRRQRTSLTHDANTHHVLYGLDADLIMLSLSTHEPNFKLIREDVLFDMDRAASRCQLCFSPNHDTARCTGEAKQKSGQFDEKSAPAPAQKPFVFFHINRLREYLLHDMHIVSPNHQDEERIIDDWVFMCLFVGNDFLPHLPSLEIREGAIDRLMKIYCSAMPQMDGYISDNGYLDLAKVEKIMSYVAAAENEIFQERKERELREKAREERRKAQRAQATTRSETPVVAESGNETESRKRKRSEDNVPPSSSPSSKEAPPGDAVPTENSRPITPVAPAVADDDEVEVSAIEDIRLGEPGWRDRYYRSKFKIETTDTEGVRQIAHAYIEGICWVMRYYYQGCASWKWYYPYHFAPFAEDFKELPKMLISFDKGVPFKPIEQLMGVFPSASSALVPKPFRRLMTDPESPIFDYYPRDFQIDMFGKKAAWQGVALLPFVDEKRLLDALAQVYPQLSEADLALNLRGNERLYVSEAHPLYESFCDLYGQGKSEAPVPMDPKLSAGVVGKVQRDPDFLENLPGSMYASPLHQTPNIEDNRAICVLYFQQEVGLNHIFSARRLTRAKRQRPELTDSDIRSIGQGGRGRGHPNAHGRYGQARGEFDVNRAVQGMHDLPAAYVRQAAYNGGQPRLPDDRDGRMPDRDRRFDDQSRDRRMDDRDRGRRPESDQSYDSLRNDRDRRYDDRSYRDRHDGTSGGYPNSYRSIYGDYQQQQPYYMPSAQQSYLPSPSGYVDVGGYRGPTVYTTLPAPVRTSQPSFLPPVPGHRGQQQQQQQLSFLPPAPAPQPRRPPFAPPPQFPTGLPPPRPYY